MLKVNDQVRILKNEYDNAIGYDPASPIEGMEGRIVKIGYDVQRDPGWPELYHVELESPLERILLLNPYPFYAHELEKV